MSDVGTTTGCGGSGGSGGTWPSSAMMISPSWTDVLEQPISEKPAQCLLAMGATCVALSLHQTARGNANPLILEPLRHFLRYLVRVNRYVHRDLGSRRGLRLRRVEHDVGLV